MRQRARADSQGNEHAHRSGIASRSRQLACWRIFPAAADDGKPRYVSGAGRDQGDCLNRFRPCRTLSYAISKAGKGDSIQVAEGSYSISAIRAALDLLTVDRSHRGRLQQVQRLLAIAPRSDETMLIGVPPEFRERFEARGLHGDHRHQRLRGQHATSAAHAQAHGEGPRDRAEPQPHRAAAISRTAFPARTSACTRTCRFDELKPASTRGNDVWGFVDLNTGREYAFMGLQNGVAVVDVTDPTAPEQVGVATGSGTTWRDIKVYQRYDATAKRWRAYAYATADNVQDFLMVLDLSDLPNGVERVNFTSDFRAAHTVSTWQRRLHVRPRATNEAPLLGVSGADLNGGSHRLYSLAQSARAAADQRLDGRLLTRSRFVRGHGCAQEHAMRERGERSRRARC